MRFWFIILVLFAAFLVTFRFEKIPVLILSKEGKVVYTKKLEDGKFILTFVHSVEKTPVYEFYEILGDDTLYLYKTRYSSMGAGLPFQAEGRFETKNGFFEAEISRRFKEISLRVSPLDGHGLLFKDDKVMFKDIANSNDLLVLSCKHSINVDFRFK
ncbi:DUF1850 domain-containing protein [Thermotoga profunda]|uniref:DUF1850 domain-containing protein n=1 Tax=Thermotoga profunda TaxID=1508420 RepID=UPI000694FAC0|nr:DUF1850 domain-containing protein [Thermotoga profunda]